MAELTSSNPHIVHHSGVACHTTAKQPVDGHNQFTYCPTCGDWFEPVGGEHIAHLAKLAARITKGQDAETK